MIGMAELPLKKHLYEVQLWYSELVVLFARESLRFSQQRARDEVDKDDALTGPIASDLLTREMEALTNYISEAVRRGETTHQVDITTVVRIYNAMELTLTEMYSLWYNNAHVRGKHLKDDSYFNSELKKLGDFCDQGSHIHEGLCHYLEHITQGRWSRDVSIMWAHYDD